MAGTYLSLGKSASPLQPGNTANPHQSTYDPADVFNPYWTNRAMSLIARINLESLSHRGVLAMYGLGKVVSAKKESGIV
jgi:hypothetical protein